MKICKIIITPSAQNDIKEIVEYLRYFSGSIASKYLAYINKTVQSLKTLPTRCALVRNVNLREKGYRWIPVRNYTIFFVVDEKIGIIRIERVLYSRREYDEIL